MRWAVLAVVLAFPAAAAEQIPDNCGGLVEACKTSGSLFPWCVGYIQGFNHGVQVFAKPGSLCVPGNVRNSQVAAVVSKFVQDHPEHWHEGPAFCVMSALMGTFACPKNEAPPSP